MIWMRALPQAFNGRGIILRNEIQVLCDKCSKVIIDWCSEQVVSYPGLPIPMFNYETGDIEIVRHEVLCDECLLLRVEELEEEGVRYIKDESGQGFNITIPVPEDYVPPSPSLWQRVVSWFYGE